MIEERRGGGEGLGRKRKVRISDGMGVRKTDRHLETY
jgi:hypothetical protein